MSTRLFLRPLVGISFVAALCVGLPAQAPTVLDQRIHRIVNGLLAPVAIKGEPVATLELADAMKERHVPGVSIAMIHDGQIEWARGFGVTSIGGAPVTPETLFQAASISKPVAALAVLRLVEAGKLSLDGEVNQYLKSWKLPENQFTEKNKVTIRELITHTAGLTVHGFAGYANGEPVPTLLQVLNGQKPANSDPIRVDTAPGTLWRYSGGGFVVSQQILEDLTGMAFPKLMHDTVLAPIGMTRSTYEQPLPRSRLSEVAMPHRGDGKPVTGGPHTYPEMAPAGLWTTPSDLARYAIEVQKSLAGTSNKVISAQMTKQMLTPGLGGWGLGPGTGGSESHRYFEHGGANEGYRCNLLAYNQGDGLVIMTNSDNGSDLASMIQRAVAKEYGWPDFLQKEKAVAKMDPKLFDAYTGSYKAEFGVFEVTKEGNRLFVELKGQPKLELFPESDHDFFVKDVEATFTFEPNTLTLHQYGRDLVAKRL